MTKPNETFVIAAKRRLLDAALKYAQAKTFGGILNDKGVWEMWCPSDFKMYQEYYLGALGQAAEYLLREMSVQDPGDMP